ncbi:MAG: DUF1059 domain-containing protein [Thaumarchaeota archaeon]|nr:DUF1059 domain-containing protein [Nitrososphaerota archaeon]
MVTLVCRDYGFECGFVAEGEDVQKTLDKFGRHTSEKHAIEYSKEVLLQFITRQKRPWTEAEAYP